MAGAVELKEVWRAQSKRAPKPAAKYHIEAAIWPAVSPLGVRKLRTHPCEKEKNGRSPEYNEVEAELN